MRRYTALVSLFGLTYVLSIYGYGCDTLSLSQITQIAKRDFNPACLVLSYKVEPEEIQRGNALAITTPISIASSVMIETASQFPSF
jgi:hypothetical protein